MNALPGAAGTDRLTEGSRRHVGKEPNLCLRFNGGILWVLNRHTHGRDMKGPGTTLAC